MKISLYKSHHVYLQYRIPWQYTSRKIFLIKWKLVRGLDKDTLVWKKLYPNYSSEFKFPWHVEPNLWIQTAQFSGVQNQSFLNFSKGKEKEKIFIVLSVYHYYVHYYVSS